MVKKGKELSISNPGTIRVTKEEFYAGGNSDPRNPNILKMFGFVNVGERAGSGVDKIMTAWAEQNWKKPEFDFSERSDRVTLKLEVGQVVYIPGAADIRNENTNQTEAIALSKEDKILEYIRQNGSISSQKAADIGGYKSKTGIINMMTPIIKVFPLTKEEMYVLLEKLAEIHAQLYEYEKVITEDEMIDFVKLAYLKRETTFITPRTMIRDFIQILDVKRQNPDKGIRDILSAYKFAVDEEQTYEDND